MRFAPPAGSGEQGAVVLWLAWLRCSGSRSITATADWFVFEKLWIRRLWKTGTSRRLTIAAQCISASGKEKSEIFQNFHNFASRIRLAVAEKLFDVEMVPFGSYSELP